MPKQFARTRLIHLGIDMVSRSWRSTARRSDSSKAAGRLAKPARQTFNSSAQISPVPKCYRLPYVSLAHVHFLEVHYRKSQIVMCLLVCSAPKSNLAMPALDVLNKAVALFETGNENGSIHLSENMVGLALLWRITSRSH